MKIFSFSQRTSKEILRDKINLIFGIAFPVVLLLLLSAIQANIPSEAGAQSLFELKKLTPGIAVFGLSFIALFSGTLIANDRSSSFMMRLFASPMKASDFILGYTIPLLPMAIAQIIFCFIVALFLGLEFTVNIFMVILVMIPAVILYISIGLLCGSLLTNKQVGGICGALLTNLSAWLSGTWFDVEMVGGTFKKAADLLPFVHVVNAGRSALNGNFDNIFSDLIWVIGYAIVVMVIAIFVFTKKMNSDNI